MTTVPAPQSFQFSAYHQQLLAVLPAPYRPNLSSDAAGSASGGNIMELLAEQLNTGPVFVRSLPIEQLDIVHDGFGWSVRQVIEHLLDAERVFGYRILRFASGDTVPLPGWDENHYAACGYSQPVDVNAMAEEFTGLRSANLCVLRRLSDSVISNMGVADNKPFSVNSICYVMAAHWIHHQLILAKRLGH